MSAEVFLPEKGQAIIDAFYGTEGIVLNNKINVRYDGPDTMLHTYEAEDGVLIHILEIDFVSGLAGVCEILHFMLGRNVELLELKKPASNFKDTAPYKHAITYQIPSNPDNVLIHAYPKGITSDFYFCFVVLGHPTDKVTLL